MEKKRLGKKEKKWIAFGAVFFVVVGGVIIYRAVQPANVLDFSTAKDFWEKEAIAEPGKQTIPLVPVNAVWTGDPFSSGHQVVQADVGSSTRFSVSVPEEGDYALTFSFYVNSSGINDTDYALEINGQSVLSKAS